MKTSTFLRAGLLALLAVAATNQAGAVPMTYNYTGGNFTHPLGRVANFGGPGVDVTASFTADAPLAASTTYNFSLGASDPGLSLRSISAGSASTDFYGFITTDALGSILSWSLRTTAFQYAPHTSILSQLSTSSDHGDAFQEDFLTTYPNPNNPNGPPFFDQNLAFGPAGTWSATVANRTPDQTNTLALFSLALIPLLGLGRAQRKPGVR
jgi:hypothetical protein